MKQRLVNTRFWSDNFVSDLNPLDRYLFLYFLTNEHTNIIGTYELPMKMMASETGLEIDMLHKMLKKLDPKVYYIDGWVFIRNFEKHQATNEKIEAGAKKLRDEIPERIMEEIMELANIPEECVNPSIPYQYPTDRVSIPYLYPSDNLIKSNLIKDTSTSDVSPGKKTETNLETVTNHNEVIDYFHRSVKEMCGFAPPINGGKDGKAVKMALKEYSFEQVKEIIDFYLQGDKIKDHGYNLAIALSKDTIGKWLYQQQRMTT